MTAGGTVRGLWGLLRGFSAPASKGSAMDRPRPPPEMFAYPSPRFARAADLEAWLRATFVEFGGQLYNEEHDHLQAAMVGALWTSEANARHMNRIVGQAEMPTFQGAKWTKARQEAQMEAWFGCLPDFVLTFDAEYAGECSDAAWCALCEHELLHCGQAKNEFGGPKFRRNGMPVYAIRGHDVEEFVTVVRRYGVAASAGRVSDLVAAAVAGPEVGAANIAACCGTCRG